MPKEYGKKKARVGESKNSSKSAGYDGGTGSNGQRIASKVNKKGLTPAKSGGDKSGGATRMW